MNKTLSTLLLAAATAASIFTACTDDNIIQVEDSTSTTGGGQVADYDSTNFNRVVAIVFSTSGSASVTGLTDDINATISGNHVTIVNNSSDKIQYNLSGKSDDGSLKIYSAKRQALYLSGLELSNTDGAAINVQGTETSPSSGKATYVVITGNNTLADGGTYSTTPDGEDEKAALFSEGQLLISGTGQLQIEASHKDAIASDDYVTISGAPTLNLSAVAGHGLRGKDSIRIAGGTIDINVSANGKKGISTDGNCTISAGKTTVVCTGATVLESGDTAKAAGIKADGDFVMKGGQLNVTASGKGAKGISADGEGHFEGGTVTVKVTGANFGSSSGGGGWWGGGGGYGNNSTGAKGIKCDKAITISGADISVSCTNHEAIETKSTLDITAGHVYAYSTGDDAINSASHMTITGGFVCGFSTGNDGLDANGNLYIKGGLVYAITTKGNPEVAVDANTEGGYKLYVQGGTLIAVGGLERGSSLTQTCYQASTLSKNTWYSLEADGVTYAFQTPSGGNSLIVSAAEEPTLKSGISHTGGTAYFNEMLYADCTTSGGTSVSLSQYNGNSGGGGGGWWW